LGNDRLSFMRFLGLGLEDRVPDARTIWLFREKHLRLQLYRQPSRQAVLATTSHRSAKASLIPEFAPQEPAGCVFAPSPKPEKRTYGHGWLTEPGGDLCRWCLPSGPLLKPNVGSDGK
jgi:hypothetical protein